MQLWEKQVYSDVLITESSKVAIRRLLPLTLSQANTLMRKTIKEFKSRYGTLLVRKSFEISPTSSTDKLTASFAHSILQMTSLLNKFILGCKVFTKLRIKTHPLY